MSDLTIYETRLDYLEEIQELNKYLIHKKKKRCSTVLRVSFLEQLRQEEKKEKT